MNSGVTFLDKSPLQDNSPLLVPETTTKRSKHLCNYWGKKLAKGSVADPRCLSRIRIFPSQSQIRILPSRIPDPNSSIPLPDPNSSSPDPGSRVKNKIADPGYGSASKNLSIFNPKNYSKLWEKLSGMFIPDPDTDFWCGLLVLDPRKLRSAQKNKISLSRLLLKTEAQD